jgi:hypothetical protein
MCKRNTARREDLLTHKNTNLRRLYYNTDAADLLDTMHDLLDTMHDLLDTDVVDLLDYQICESGISA